MTTQTQTQTHTFEAEISELMGLIVHSFYSNKDIFLRELVSNASDALDKIRHESLTDPSVLETNNKLHIRIIPDKESNTLTIEDDGVGMSQEDLINNLGTIARSGTKNFTRHLKEQGDKTDMSLIGQFGVGFYSAFLVANEVEVFTKTHDGDEYVWKSDATKQYTIDSVKEKTLKRGTRMVLHLKDDALDYLEESTLRNIISRHSQYVGYDIHLMVDKEIDVEVEEDEPLIQEVSETDDVEDPDDNAEDKPVIEDVEIDPGDKPVVEDVTKPKTEKQTVKELEHLNKQKPIWCRNKDEVTEDEYKEFYKSITKDYDENIAHLHFNVEGGIEFSSIMYLPNRGPFDMFGSQNKDQNNVKLYVKKVFIMDDCKELIPEWLSFVKGVVDCKDLPLNVSRELLQQNKTLGKIKTQLVKKTIEMMQTLADDKPDDYKTFYDAFNKNIKLGIHEDAKNRTKISKLLRYHSLNHIDEKISLEKYVEEMKDGQENIYFISGESIKAVQNSPFLEKLKTKGFDVLFYTDPIDEYVSQQLKEYDDKKMMSVSSKSLKFDENEEENKQLETEFDGLSKKLKTILSGKVQNVTVSTRVVDSPACLVTDDAGYSANMQRIMRAQALGNNNDMMMQMMNRKDMEINPKHKIIIELNKRFQADNDDPMVANLSTLLYDVSLLTSGFTIEDPSTFAAKFNRMIQLGLSIDEDEEEDEDKDNIVLGKEENATIEDDSNEEILLQPPLPEDGDSMEQVD